MVTLAPATSDRDAEAGDGSTPAGEGGGKHQDGAGGNRPQHYKGREDDGEKG